MRTAVGVVAGYVALFLFVVVFVTAAFLALGTDRVFRPGTLEVTPVWLVVNISLSFVGAVVGGWFAVWIGQARKASLILAALVVVLGLAMAFLQPSPKTILTAEEIAELSPMEASSHARQPEWYAFLLPALGAAGIIVGGRLRTTAKP